jgi:hypothetical protein
MPDLNESENTGFTDKPAARETGLDDRSRNYKMKAALHIKRIRPGRDFPD